MDVKLIQVHTNTAGLKYSNIFSSVSNEAYCVFSESKVNITCPKTMKVSSIIAQVNSIILAISGYPCSSCLK